MNKTWLLAIVVGLSLSLIWVAEAAQELKQSTQVQVVIGPFVDKTDGLTPEVDFDFSGADECALVKAGGTTGVSLKAATWADVVDVNGYYVVTLTTSHTDTLGPLTIAVNDDATFLPVLARFQVLDPNAWDQKYSTGELKGLNLDSIKGNVDILDPNNYLYAKVMFISAGSNAATTSDIPTVSEISDKVWVDDVNATTLSLARLKALMPGGAAGAVDPNSMTDAAWANLIDFVDGTGYAGGTAKLGVNLVAATDNVIVDVNVLDMFAASTGTYAGSGAGSVVKEIADNAGGASLTVSDIADKVWTDDANSVYFKTAYLARIKALLPAGPGATDPNAGTMVAFADINDIVPVDFNTVTLTGAYINAHVKTADVNAITVNVGQVAGTTATALATEAEIAEATQVKMDASSTQLSGIIEDTGTTLPDLIGTPDTDLATDINNVSGRVDALVADANDAALYVGTVAAASTNQRFTLSSAFPAVKSALPRGVLLVVWDADDGFGYAGFVQSYTAGRVVTLSMALPITPANADVVRVYPAGAYETPPLK